MQKVKTKVRTSSFDARSLLSEVLSEKASKLILGDNESGFSKFGIEAPGGGIIVAVEVRYYTEYTDAPIQVD